MTSERKRIAKVKTVPKGGKFIVDPPPKVNLLPDTTLEEDTMTAGQRRINLIWEITQALTAIMITTATIYNAINKIESDVLTNAFFLIVSMYFVRTNHQLTGGTGPKPTPEKQQR